MKKKSIYAACLMSLCVATSAIAEQTVTLTTSKAVGEKMQLMVNPAGVISVNWGDGTFVDYPSTIEAFRFIEGEVKGETIVIKGSDNQWDLLGCAGQNITTIDVTNAPELRSLYCQDNEIKSMALSKAKNLTDLNASNNVMAATGVKPSTHALMENIDLSGNSIKNNGSGTTFAYSTNKIQRINISNNKVVTVTISNASQLDALYCGSNDIKTLNFATAPNLTTVCCEDNVITKFTALDSLKTLRTFVATNNKLSTVDFSNSSELTTLNVASNGLTSVTLPNKKLVAYDCSDNELTFGSLPKATYKPTYIKYLPQAEIIVTGGMKKSVTDAPYMDVCPSYSERNNADYILDVSDYKEGPGHASSGVTVTAIAIEDDGTERELTKATASKPNNEYSYSSGKLVFYQPQKRVYIKFTNTTYKDLVLTSDVFCVGEEVATGIEDVKNATDNLEVLTQPGYVTLNANVRTLVTIFDLSGKKVWGGTVVGTTTINLPSGVYIINGQKFSI